jgi:hypothetical protein
VQHVLRRSIAFEHDKLVIGGLDGGRLLIALNQLAAHGGGRRVGWFRRFSQAERDKNGKPKQQIDPHDFILP